MNFKKTIQAFFVARAIRKGIRDHDKQAEDVRHTHQRDDKNTLTIDKPANPDDTLKGIEGLKPPKSTA